MALVAERAAVGPAHTPPSPAPAPARRRAVDPDEIATPAEVYTRAGKPVATAVAGPLDHRPGHRTLDVLGDLVGLIDRADHHEQLTHTEACVLLGITTEELQLLLRYGAIRCTPDTELLDLRAVLRPRPQPIRYRT